MLHGSLAAEGLVINRKRTCRLYCEAGLQVRTRRRKKVFRPRQPLLLPDRPGQRWSVDFTSDQFAAGRRVRLLNLVADYARECVGQIVDPSIAGVRLARYLDELGQARALLETLVCDNGTELTSKALFFWSQKAGVKLHFIHPGKPNTHSVVSQALIQATNFNPLEDFNQKIAAMNDALLEYNKKFCVPDSSENASLFPSLENILRLAISNRNLGVSYNVSKSTNDTAVIFEREVFLSRRSIRLNQSH